MTLNRGGPINKDVGIFLNADHLLAVSRSLRAPSEVLKFVQIANTRLLLGGSTSHQVIVADCSVVEQRRLADEFALQAGFHVRHAPTEGPSASSIVSAEALSAASLDRDLRVVVIGDDLVSQQAAVDVLHRLKRWVVLLSKEWATVPSRHADLLLDLPLDRGPLLATVEEILERLGRDEADLTDLRNELSISFPGFRPAMFGFENMSDLVKASRKRSMAVAAARQRMTVSTDQIDSTDSPMPVVQQGGRRRTRPNSDPERAAVRSAVVQLPRLSEEQMQCLGDIEIGQLLLASLDSPSVDDYCRRRGVDMQLFIDGIRRITGRSGWKPTASVETVASFPSLMYEIALINPEWTVGVPLGKAGVHLIKRGTLPEGWQEYEPPTSELDVETETAANQS